MNDAASSPSNQNATFNMPLLEDGSAPKATNRALGFPEVAINLRDPRLFPSDECADSEDGIAIRAPKAFLARQSLQPWDSRTPVPFCTRTRQCDMDRALDAFLERTGLTKPKARKVRQPHQLSFPTQSESDGSIFSPDHDTLVA
jgi:hypothetical protein